VYIRPKVVGPWTSRSYMHLAALLIVLFNLISLVMLRAWLCLGACCELLCLVFVVVLWHKGFEEDVVSHS
jgi:hypothetical protein